MIEITGPERSPRVEIQTEFTGDIFVIEPDRDGDVLFTLNGEQGYINDSQDLRSLAAALQTMADEMDRLENERGMDDILRSS